MPSVLPEGDPVPADGSLPRTALEGLGERPFGFYLHVPFCVTRCGYCDFNTYTAAELGPGASRDSYADTLIGEVRLARRVLGDVDLPVETVFVGGGTPTLLPPGDLGRVLQAVREEFGLAAGAEVTTEANPETVDRAYLDGLRAGGFTRISYGMQSARDHVLKALDRTHTPAKVPVVVREAREAGFDHVNLDLIYGTPGESDDDWRASLESALAAGPDHVSAYALIVEEGTKLAAQVKRGELDEPDDDAMADRYLMADELLGRAGMEWYELSNWALPGGECRHNVLYWRGADWWGAGPGAHSHVGGTRWWNVKHPAAYAQRLHQDITPAHAREILDPGTRKVERVLLEIRLREGCPLELLDARGVQEQVDQGLLERVGDRAVLTLRGRLLADAVVRDLT
ncbi:radical SAM family heme chaperone HemW [Actinocorallia longicatena]|uniref:Heme chaperone HemW n=1 Tax=Actinocorallia longicatena TaxID=111803 RepID=A0ABP6QLD8_9ACTN